MNKKVLIVDNGTKYLTRLKEMLADFATDVLSYEKLDVSELADYDLVILSGGHDNSIVGHEEEFSKELDFIKNTDKPFIGICLGFELIAYAYGAILKIMTQREKSLLSIKVIEKDLIFDGREEYLVYENHKWAVDKLPNDFKGLAKSEDGFEIIKHKSRPIYGFQFHPEIYTENSNGDELFLNTVKLLLNVSE